MNTVQDVTVATLHSHPLPQIGRKIDKDSRGRVFMVAGSASSPGAALLAGEAALRGGAGKVLVGTTSSIALGLGLQAPEFGIKALAATPDGEPDASDPGIQHGIPQCDAMLLGPGLMNEDNARLIALSCFQTLDKPFLLDAAAVSGLSGNFDVIRAARQPRILTPHAGEMAKLMNIRRDVIEKSAREIAAEAARTLNCVLVLKGAETYVAMPEGEIFQHTGGTAGLGTAGSGDTLAGLIAALLARGADPLSACLWGVFIHAKSGEILTRTVGRLGFLAREIPRQFPHLLQSLEPGRKSGSEIPRGVA
ncbi:MAG: NAD(P)H-hydrate dehydratase [Steroidobacteraceae bacterium]